ncbi:DHA2 family efflux MFS transporter permease subunit [Pallidibacillus thermolactis]|jgi:EmrB/QacA subfamily drug resistance transporter|uniref:DHA2 family efflux MFS transporter permease subunit n=1 Tax=Pallidibacillus thermolactis TaxID=251051 RepID=UPI00156B9320|nr:DHA2 family efflux MFS transporter permease subunit [Pallidibacillus thermolactis]MCU9599922.1 DHA2 family efflux MFS transporter permease subunit [Pallidibacillus thermolactis subsp. kokeshiiformis]MED1674805.1 DHA2 family efflux MFS transporter permease subunit [Pallidibacillus thermolactis subsp. kokeshiiformis]
MTTNKIDKKPPYLMIAILFFGAFISFLNNSLLNVALPTIMVDFEKDYATVQWLATGYMLVSGILIPASAFLITRFKNRHLFITAMSLFTLGTALAAYAPNFGLLLTGRMIQAAGSSVMGPLLMNIMLVSFPREKRGTAMGVFGLVMITAPAIGPTLSGYIVEHWDWRLLFEMILPFAIISLILAIWKLENIMETRHTTLDYLSVVLSILGFGGVLYGCSTASNDGWTDVKVLTTLIFGGLGIILFIIRQLRLENPLLDLHVYKYPMFALGSIISMVITAAMFSGMILTPAYVQSVRGISPLDSGLIMLPGAIVMGIMSPITGKLFDKFGPRVLAFIGISITAYSTYLLSGMDLETTKTTIVLMYTLRMFGMSMVMMPIMTNGLNQLPTRLNPHGTAINNTVQQVVGSIGTALFVTLMNSVATNKGEELLEAAKEANPEKLQDQTFLIGIQQQALLEGIQISFLVATGVTILALILSIFLKRVNVNSQHTQQITK